MVEFSLKRCGGIFGMLYFDASWWMNLLLTSWTCESNSLKLDVAFAMLPSALRMANFFLSVSQINDPQAKRTGCKVRSLVRCFPWWRSWLVTIWKVKDELLGPWLDFVVSIRINCVKCTWMLWKICLAFSDGISAEEVRRVSKVHVRAVGRARLKGLTEEASTEFFERLKREAFWFIICTCIMCMWIFRLGRSSSSMCTLFWSPFWAGHISHGLGLGSRWGVNSKETCMTMMERSSMQPGDAGSLWGGLGGSSCWSTSAFKSLGTRLSFLDGYLSKPQSLMDILC